MFDVVHLDNKGRSIVSTQDIKKDTLVISDFVIVLNEEEVKYIEKTKLINYVFSWENESSALSLGYGSLLNHSDNPNLIFILDVKQNKLHFYSLRDISKNEELTIDYVYCDESYFS